MIIITGGAGYIGKNIAFYLLQQGEKVLLIDNYNNSTPKGVESLLKQLDKNNISRDNIRFALLDLTDRFKTNTFFFQEISYLMHEILFSFHIKGIIHCAGHKSVSDSVVNPLEYYRNNLISTINLIECVQIMNKMNEVDKKPHIPIIFSSSTTVYGTCESPLVETTNCDIKTVACPYGKTKFMIEEILQDCSKYVKTISLRYFNPIGCFENLDEEINDKSTNLIPSLIKSIINNKIFKVFGNDYNTRDGTCIRDYIDVRDLARAHYLALQHCSKMNQNYEVINLGTQKGTSVKELLETFEKVREVKLNYEFVEKREGDLPSCYANGDKAFNVLGWKPEYSIEDSLKSISL